MASTPRLQGCAPSSLGRQLRRELAAEAIAASTSMEGVPVTVDEVRRILAGEPPPDVRSEDRELVEGYREAMEFVLRRADDNAFRWNGELLVALHDRILAGRYITTARGGSARTSRPSSSTVELVRQFLFHQEGRTSQISLTKLAHAWRRVTLIQESPPAGSMWQSQPFTHSVTVTEELLACARR